MGKQASRKNMATVYLHIGTMKTGTSALQRFLDDNREYLESQGYVYPRMKQGLPADYFFRNGHFLVYSFDRKKTLDVLEVFEGALEQLAGLAGEYENIILSDEVIWHCSARDPEFWRKISEEFQKINCRIKVILYLRRQDTSMESLYNQAIKSGNMLVRDFDDYVQGRAVKYFSFHYYEGVRNIETYIGKENISIRVYDKEQPGNTENSLFSDFLNEIGLSFDENYHVEQPVKNPGLQGNYIEIKRIINSLPEYRETGNFMARPLVAASRARAGDQLKENNHFFTMEKRKEFLAEFEEGNRKLAREYLGREDGSLFDEPSEESEVWEVNEELLYQDIILATAEVFCMQEKELRELKDRICRLEEAERIRAGRWIRRIYRGFKAFMKKYPAVEGGSK